MDIFCVCDSRRYVWYLLWNIGLVLTIYACKGNWTRYRQFDSIVNERDYDYYGSKTHHIPVMFPIIIACANSMHSLAKVAYTNKIIY